MIHRSRLQLASFTILGFSVAILGLFGLLGLLLKGEERVELAIHRTPGVPAGEEGMRTRTLSVATLNVAHGRKDGASQVFQGEQNIRLNLQDVSRVLKREDADIVGLQEADDVSVWSGAFNHVALIAQEAGYPFYVMGEHVRGPGLSYGTAILSRQQLSEAYSVTFEVAPPTLTKGFVAARCHWPGDPGWHYTLASIHLDFSRGNVRRHQVERIAWSLAGSGPLVVMGDFNSSWSEGSPPELLARHLGLKRCTNTPPDMVTFALVGGCFDWILVSKHFDFVSYRVIPDIISDHRAVVAELRRAK